jgi:hypothetical protein
VTAQAIASSLAHTGRVSFFRPTRKVTAPDGRTWEIYVSRFEPPSWKPSDYQSLADDLGGTFYLARLFLLFFLIEIPLFLIHEVLWPLLRMIVTLPWTVAKGLRSRQLRVEAVSFFPWPESHLWLTTKDHVGRVVEQVAAGLESGGVARPLGADFKGSQEMVASTFRGLRRDD